MTPRAPLPPFESRRPDTLEEALQAAREALERLRATLGTRAVTTTPPGGAHVHSRR